MIQPGVVQAGGLRFERSPRALNVNWSLTRKCNYTCSYCRVYDNVNGEFPALELLERAVGRLAQLDSDEIFLTLSGGEPTVHPEYANLLGMLLERIPSIVRILTITNLGRTPRYYESLLARVAGHRSRLWFKASFHFDHAEQEAYFANARLFAEAGVHIKMAVMAHPDRMVEVRDVFGRMRALVSEFPDAGRCEAVVIRTMQGGPDPRYLSEDLQWLGEEGGDEEANVYIDHQDAEGNVDRQVMTAAELVARGRNSFKGMWCNAGINMLAISDKGDVVPAVCFKWRPSGNNIYSERSSLQLLARPTRCPHDKCGCLADIAIPKMRAWAGAQSVGHDEAIPAGSPIKLVRRVV